jgi:hypothetical protein
MESVEGMMQGLKLSEEERKSVKIGWRKEGRRGDLEEQAIGKLMADKPAIPDAVANALGPIWCPMKGIKCKDLGENHFLFTFLQPGGKKKAVDSGPWMFERELLVIEDFVPTKTLEEYEFAYVPVWVHVHKLPLGMMNKETGELIGEQIGEFMEVAGVEDGMAVGRYLRIKVRKCIHTPLMRGTLVEVDDEGRKLWCPFQYEFLPDFCYICGIMGHVDRDCAQKLMKGEEPQFGKWLKWVPPKKKSTFVGGRSWGDRGGKGSYILGSRGGGSGSDAPSWRKEIMAAPDKEKVLSLNDGVGEEGGLVEQRGSVVDVGKKTEVGLQAIKQKEDVVEERVVKAAAVGNQGVLAAGGKGDAGEVGAAGGSGRERGREGLEGRYEPMTVRWKGM